MSAFSRVALAALAAVLAAGCSENSTQPVTPGVVAVLLNTPNTTDGAVSIVLTGPGVGNVQPGSSAYAVYWRVATPGEVRFIVVGDLSAGVVAEVAVGDVNHLDKYQTQVLEVATRNDASVSTTGYAVTLSTAH